MIFEIDQQFDLEDTRGNTCLHYLAMAQKSEQQLTMLDVIDDAISIKLASDVDRALKITALIGKKNTAEQTALQIAFANKNKALVIRLMELGADHTTIAWHSLEIDLGKVMQAKTARTDRRTVEHSRVLMAHSQDLRAIGDVTEAMILRMAHVEEQNRLLHAQNRLLLERQQQMFGVLTGLMDVMGDRGILPPERRALLLAPLNVAPVPVINDEEPTEVGERIPGT